MLRLVGAVNRAYVRAMPDLQIEPRKHSSLYELKPMSRWWLVLALVLSGLCVVGNGWSNPVTWALLFCGWMVGFAMILTNPKTWLSKLKD
jgi:hypothetical protein